MDSEETLREREDQKCRICFQSFGNIISPCRCSGSVKYIHEQCLNLWISKALDTNKKKLIHNGDSRYSVKCQLCEGDIYFQMRRQKGCRKFDEIQENIQSDREKFVCLLVILLVISLILMLVFYFSVREILIGENLLEIIFFSTFNVLLLLIWARFVYGFASIFFFGKIYSFQGYELNLTSDK